MQLMAGKSFARPTMTALFCSLALATSTSAWAQSDDELFEEDEADAALEEDEEVDEDEEGGGEKALASAPDDEEEINSDLIRAPDRDAPAGTPLIANKKYEMDFRFELTGSFDFSYGERFVRQTGGHIAAGMHIFDWLQVEAFGGYMGLCSFNTPAGPLHPAGCELGITRFVRTGGLSQRTQEQPKLSDLWQTGGFGGVTVQWAPIYGKLSMVSEYDLSFQLYGFGGLGVDHIWKVATDTSGGTFEYTLQSPDIPVTVSGHFGAGLRFIPWKFIAIRAELRNYVRVNPVVGDDYPDLDIGWNSMVNLGVSFLL